MEPYTSAAVNNKNFRTIPRGVYAGFNIVPGPGTFEVTVNTDTPTGITGYLGGNFDTAQAMGWSIAVHETLTGFTSCIIMQRGVNSEHVFDLTAFQGTVVYIVLDVQYSIGIASSAQVKIVDDAELDANPDLLCLGKVEVPTGVAIDPANIILDDPLYPRVLPFANPSKYGFMSKDHADILEILSTTPGASTAYEEEYILAFPGPQIITIPAGQTYVVGGNDLFIFKNGVKLRKGRDYTEIDRGDGFGNDVTFLANLRVDDRILFRGQAYAVSLVNTLAVKDEYAVIGSNVTSINFSGTGVTAIPDGPNQVRVIIPAPSGASTGNVKYKQNLTGLDIPNGRAVHLLPDGSIVPCNPVDPTHKPYGITNGPATAGNYGYVVVSGNAEDALLGVGAVDVGDDIYVSHGGNGSLTRTPPDPFVGSVFRMGIADCPSSATSAVATDVVLAIQRI